MARARRGGRTAGRCWPGIGGSNRAPARALRRSRLASDMARRGAVVRLARAPPSPSASHCDPTGAVLVFQRHDIAARVAARNPTRVMQQHQREQAVQFGFLRHQPDEEPGKTDRFVAEMRLDQTLARCGSVPFVKNQIHDRTDGFDAFDEPRRIGNGKRNAGVANFAFGAHEPLRHRRNGNQNARAICSVSKPPSVRRVKAMRASGFKLGWHSAKIRLRRSSGIAASSSSTSNSGTRRPPLQAREQFELLVPRRSRRSVRGRDCAPW